jgi:5-methyltetrahydropteroyltriglutamate--homocysteine methyltransferase
LLCCHLRLPAADVLTIENSRSGDAMVSALAAAGYSKDLGPGVYDVHSPQVGGGLPHSMGLDRGWEIAGLKGRPWEGAAQLELVNG